MMFFEPRAAHRQALLAQPFPDEWLAYLREDVLLYRLLSEMDQARLQDALRVFIAGKFWEGCGGLTITDEIKVTVAAQACLLVLGFDGYYFDELRSILVYPGGYLARNPDRLGGARPAGYRLGEAHRRGPVILSWWHVRWDGRRLGSGNLVLHEFAHKLAELGDPHAGMPPMHAPALADRWEQVTAAEYARLCEDACYDRPTLLDPYGATNRAEFFAVATECFFLQPVPLRRRQPELYQVLADWFRQDPASRRAPDEAEAARADEAEDEYARHVIAECSAAIRQHPDGADAYRGRADFHFGLGEFEEAVADYGAVIRLRPKNVDTYCDRGITYRVLGRYEEALADFDRALRLCPGYARAYCERGVTHARRGDDGRALADLTRAVRADPKDDGARVERGLVYAARGEHDKAVRDFSRAIRLCPYYAPAFAHRAVARLARGERDGALADCAEAERLDPDHAAVRRARELLQTTGDP
jgi:Mlc titration factor MtfA (ptsG expression regulator)/Tfp pilus assembly protein PilF